MPFINRSHVSMLLLLMFAVQASKYPPAYSQPPSDPKLFKPFPKKVWAYWGSGFEKAMIWTHLCVNNMRHFSQVSGWEFYFLSDENFTSFLTPASAKKLNDLLTMNSTYNITKTSKSDLIRIFLLLDNGGMWIDANSFFLGDFTWIEKLYEQPYVFNRFFPNPDMLSFSYNQNYGGNKTVVWDEKLGRKVYLHPGMESWVMIAKPNSSFYQDVAKNFETCLRLGKDKMDAQNRALGIQFHEDGQYYFYLANYQYQLALQSKQKQLDALGGPIKYAVEYYGMWSVQAKYSGFILRNNLDAVQMHQSLIFYSLEDLNDIFQQEIPPMFIKMVGWLADQMNHKVINFYNKTCNLQYGGVTKNSLFYTYLVNITSTSPVTDKIKRNFALYQNQDYQACNMLSKPTIFMKQFQNIILLVLIALIFCLPLLSKYISRQKNEFQMIAIDQQFSLPEQNLEQEPKISKNN